MVPVLMAKSCKEYRDAPNPTPETITYRAWVLSDQQGRILRRYPGAQPVFHRKPEGEMGWDGSIWKPRRVWVTLEFEDKRK